MVCGSLQFKRRLLPKQNFTWQRIMEPLVYLMLILQFEIHLLIMIQYM